MTIKLGFVGTGTISNHHLVNLKEMEDVSVTAFCDIQLERADAAAKEWPAAKAYRNMTDMLDDRKLDGLYICVPPMAHGKLEMHAIERNIPFLVEKPLGLTMDLALSLAEKVKEKDLLTAVGYQWRYRDAAAKAKELLQACKLGMALGYRMGGLPATPWWRRMKMSGGQFVEMTTHIVDLLIYLCGEVEEVYAAFGHRVKHEELDDIDIPDVGTVSMKLRSGAVATISNTCMLAAGQKIGLDLYTNKGVISISPTGLSHRRVGGTDEFTCRDKGGLSEDEAFLHAIRTGDRSRILSQYEDALHTLEVTLAANESASSGCPVKLKQQVGRGGLR
jgi:predicted dehydrogenase